MDYTYVTDYIFVIRKVKLLLVFVYFSFYSYFPSTS